MKKINKIEYWGKLIATISVYGLLLFSLCLLTYILLYIWPWPYISPIYSHGNLCFREYDISMVGVPINNTTIAWIKTDCKFNISVQFLENIFGGRK